MIEWELTSDIVLWCQNEWDGRQRRAIERHRKDVHGLRKPVSHEKGLAGVMAEKAVADWSGEKMLCGEVYDLYARGTKRPNVGDDIHVVSTIYEGGMLLLHDDDAPERRAVLGVVIMKRRLVLIPGWVKIGEIQSQPERYFGPLNSEERDCYRVPQRDLRSMKTFRCKNRPNAIEAASVQESLW
jgi:hypothetical protein